MNIQAVNISTFSLALILTVGATSAQAFDATKKANNWYLKTMVLAEGDQGMFFNDRAGVIGRIDQGQNGYDLHDIKVFQSVTGSEAGIAFVRSEGGFEDNAGSYLSDYRGSGKDKQVWDFSVFSSMTNSTVTLTWDGLYEIDGENGNYDTELNTTSRTLRVLRLIDLDQGKVATRAMNKKGVIKSYTFNMGPEGVRHFRWVLGKPTPTEKTQLPAHATQLLTTNSFEAKSSKRTTQQPMIQTEYGKLFPPLPTIDAGAESNASSPVINGDTLD